MATPEAWDIKVIKYRSGYKAQFRVGNQYFLIGELVTKKEAECIKRMFEKAIENLIYHELQRYEIFKKINYDLEDSTVENIIEKYLK